MTTKHIEQLALWAIRLKGTDKYLPHRDRQYGHSFSEPTNIDDAPPRLFFTERSAKAALASWLLGKHHKHRSHYYDDYFGDSGYDEYIEIVPQADRKRENMEIVAFTVTEQGQG